MRIFHISAECYPAAKAGGLGDVVGALPKYQKEASVIIPKYKTPWLEAQEYSNILSGTVRIHLGQVSYTVQKVNNTDLNFNLFVVDIPTKFDRPGIYMDPGGYGFGDELERALSFQQAALHFIMSLGEPPKILHCHDHHTGLIPFFIEHSPEFHKLKGIPTVFTIHNGEYHGAFSWQKSFLLPYFDAQARGYLDWNNTINPLASAIKCAWKVTTVSPSYMEELKSNSNGLENLLNHEWRKTKGILNGIDTKVWDPTKDKYLAHQLNGTIESYKEKNKDALTEHFGLNKELPIVTFIGRLAKEKGADLLPDAINHFLSHNRNVSFVILGTGDPMLHQRLAALKNSYPANIGLSLEYNEGLAHQLYAGSDFLFMPSKVEPCGLNQMYAMRYGTIPIVRSVGGLRDTVNDIGTENGCGINFTYLTVHDATMAIHRASEFYKDKVGIKEIRKRIMNINFSWENSASIYRQLYQELNNQTPEL